MVLTSCYQSQLLRKGTHAVKQRITHELIARALAHAPGQLASAGVIQDRLVSLLQRPIPNEVKRISFRHLHGGSVFEEPT